MKYDNSIFVKVNSLVREAIEHGYDVLDFLEDVNYATINAIHNGYIFDNYIEQRHLVEALDYVEFLPETDNWEELVKKAMKRKGMNYDEEMKRIEDKSEIISNPDAEESIMKCLG